MNFKKYSTYSVEEFIEDEGFRNWVQQPTKFTDKYWQDFLVAHPGQKENIQQARQLLGAIDTYFDETDDTAIDENFAAALKETLHHTKKQAATKTKRVRLFRTWAAVAASLLIIIGSCFGIWKTYFNETTPLYYAADYGEWKTITLPDASIVYLNAHSTLQLSENWDKGTNRKVWLDGEAFFEVSKQPATKATFTVVTDGLNIEVLGTQFNVNTKSTEHTEVFLEEGKINLEFGTTDKIMQPGELVAYSKKTKKIIEQATNLKELPGAWRTGVLTLKSKTITEIAQKIEEIYGVQVVLENDSLASEIRTIAIPLDRLEIAIPILEATLQAHIEQRGKKLFIR